MSAKRCLMVLPGGYPPGDAKASRIQLLAAGLRCSGWDVRVLAVGGKLENGSFESDDYGTKYCRTVARKGVETGDIIAVAVQRIFSLWGFDALLLYGPYWKVLEKAHSWGVAKGCESFADCTEWYGWRPWRTLNSSFLDHLKFRANLKRFSGVIAVSEFWSAYSRSRKLPYVQVAAPIDTKFRMAPRVQARGCNRSRNIALAYLGALTRRNLALTLLEIVHLSLRRGVRVTLHCYGHHPMASNSAFVRRLVRLELGEHVVFHGRLKQRSEVVRAMGSADALILLRGQDRASRGSFPTRLPEMLASGTPVITSATADVQRDLVDLRDAYLIPPGHRPGFAANALCRIATRPEEALEIGETGSRSAARLYDYKVLGARLSDFMSDQLTV